MKTVKAKLIVSMLALFVAILAVGGAGWYAATVANGGLRTVFNDRVKPLGDLKAVADGYAVEIVDAAHKIRAGTMEWSAGERGIAAAMDKARKHWATFFATYMEAEERALADAAAKAMSNAEASVNELSSIVRAKDKPRLDRFVTETLYPAIDPVSDALSKLVELQINVAGAQYAESAESFAVARMAMIASVTAGGLALAFAVWIVLIQVSRPLTSLTEAMKELASGNFSVVLPGLGRQDEVGGIAGAVDEFKARLEEKMRLEAEKEREIAEREQAERDERARKEAEAAAAVTRVVASLGSGLERLARGDLTYRLSDEFTAEYKKIQNDFNSAIAQLQETVRNIAMSSSEISSAASEISTSTTDLSQRTEEQAASLEQTSASMEEIAATVKKNAENAQHANQLTRQTREVADRGGAVVSQAVTAMARIEESSRQISDIISVIDEIARQTNLLALNAAVEAARAGEAGRGFAVVASEVRSLAQRSSQAAKDIKDLIVNSSGQVQEGVDLVNRAGESLSEILESIKSVADIVSDIADASSEQASGVDQINKALGQMDEVTQQNSALVEENAATAKTLEDQQLAMSERIGFFRFGDDHHLKAAPQRKMVSTERRDASAAMPRQRPARAATLPVQGNLAVAVYDQSGEWEQF